jgi:predicted RNA-binding Zn ribbon-like protein
VEDEPPGIRRAGSLVLFRIIRCLAPGACVTLAGLLDVVDAVDTVDLGRVLALRESVYEVFGPIAAGEAPRPEALAHVVATSAVAVQAASWLRTGAAYELRWPAQAARSVVHSVADAAVQLLRSPALARLRSCDGCGWLFLDTSRGGARRWCSMNACGARHKMRRYHERRSPRARS